jgi:hypothetical protein
MFSVVPAKQLHDLSRLSCRSEEQDVQSVLVPPEQALQVVWHLLHSIDIPSSKYPDWQIHSEFLFKSRLFGQEVHLLASVFEHSSQ